MAAIRLDKYLTVACGLSRTEAKEYIRSSRVSIRGVLCRTADRKIEPATDPVAVDGIPVQYREHVYIMLHKPAGIVSASKDTREKTVVDLVPPELFRKGLFPAGRLDRDTTGFVLLTDDGDFAHRILAPGKHVPKTYLVTLTRGISPAENELLLAGPALDGEQLQTVRATCMDDEKHIYSVILLEGRYHQIKRMFAAQGNAVLALHRIKMGALALDETLQPGACRLLNDEELKRITEIT